MAAPTTPTTSLVLEASSPYYLHPFDQPGHALVSQLFNGDNYPTWNCAIIMALEAKNKLGFVDGIPKPKAPSTDLPYWIRCNNMVQSWLVHFTIPSIANSILWITDAHAVWADLHDNFFQKNASRIFEIRQAISNCTQGTNAIATYYTTLKGFWDELSSYHKLSTCSCGAFKDLSTTIEIDHLIDFLQ
ncbi:hypothetical protein NE237_032117 [Protea cynaroides]|uniref:Retrotransposon Copia-like N-terminal domain-containing protein n=1 Tax=Protea cynaroides TaxID=273540 RepID=A0A9Q0R2S5_9MAGN|nr:hypothetical protein NE237_032117 [Protea cynaroides]